MGKKIMKFIYYNLLVILVVLTSFSKASKPDDAIPEHETFKMHSKQVAEERTINVWIPANYKTNTDSLPVMYMADGGIQEDFPHLANTLAKLIQENKIKPLILVGIENTQRRRDLTGFTEVAKDKEIAPVVGGSEKFRAFIKEELFPEINKRYRVTPRKSIIGESLAGLFVVETFFLRPDLFDHYIAFDPSLWWNDHYLIKTTDKYLNDFSKTEKRIWFAGSNTEGISLYTDELAKIFQKKNLSTVQWNYSPEPKEKHNTIFRATKEKAIIWTLNKTE